MPIATDDLNFLQGPFQAIEGWCVDEAAWLTTHLLRLQQSEDHFAPSFEIGVYKGKYLSVLHNCARLTGAKVIGIDKYDWVGIPEVEEGLRKVFGDLTGLALVQGDSMLLTPSLLTGHLDGQKAGFASVDGAHTPQAVFSDLVLTESVLEPWGIVSLDDFLNPMALGVTDGAMRFWLTAKTDLVPFCYCRNKLFAAHRDMAERYSEATLAFCEENASLPAVKIMLDHKNLRGIHWAKQEFLGQHVWILPP